MTRIVVAGVGRFTDRNYEFPKALSPVEMCAEACRRAERDTGRDGILKDVVAIGTYHEKKNVFDTRLDLSTQVRYLRFAKCDFQ